MTIPLKRKEKLPEPPEPEMSEEEEDNEHVEYDDEKEPIEIKTDAEKKREELKIKEADWLLLYEQENLKLNDIEIQIKSQKKTITDTNRIDGLISTNELLITLKRQQYNVASLKENLLELGLDRRDLEEIEKRVVAGVKSYDLWTIK